MKPGWKEQGFWFFFFPKAIFYEVHYSKSFWDFVGPWVQDNVVSHGPRKRQGNVASTWLKLSPKISQRKNINEENNFALNVERVVKLKARVFYYFFKLRLILLFISHNFFCGSLCTPSDPPIPRTWRTLELLARLHTCIFRAHRTPSALHTPVDIAHD